MRRTTISALLGGLSCGLVLLTGTDARLTAQQAAGSVTFTKDIAPILQRSCQNCHHPGSVAPMSLLTYEDARPYASSMKKRKDRDVGGCRSAARQPRRHATAVDLQGRGRLDYRHARSHRRDAAGHREGGQP